ncbi:DUF4835 family protein [Aquimarina spongiae]|uniref:DUF4835 domain-containing protein n=1 Tax=Aquimarina spongiae TaxID=570521 RepID=A0A1M6G3F4_9FLAO|nr:DUF4835 family protein [Aquimarina spongiae]SHJ04486.1 protein of unknown function [Aquimarina spongiae]
MNRIFLIVLLVFGCNVYAQEFNATVVVNAEQTGNPNLQVFKTLERSLTEFINNTVWTNIDYRTEERIDCSFFITVVGFDNDAFTATLQVQASRPVYGSNYSTTILNVNDRQFNFNYLEFQPLNYNPNNFESNLISVVSFYLYMILGVDADSFALNSGTDFYQEAKNIVGNAQSSNALGWNPADGLQSRFRFNDDLLSGTFDGYRETMYTYHREGLDQMHNNVKQGKQTILKAMKSLEKLHSVRPNSFIMRVFFDSKAGEISSILSGGPSVNIAETVGILNKIAPTYADNWKDIKF